jgi:RimJ/RimL family protein N-acetyltransferase
MTWSPGDLVELETERFILRSVEREDATDAVTGWLEDPDVMVGLNMPRQRMTKAQAVRWILQQDNLRRFVIVVIDKETSTPIGLFTITNDTVNNCVETAVVIGNHDYWGKNVVIEARTALMDFIFDNLKSYKVVGKPHGRNFSSIFNYKAMGFTCEAILREHMRPVQGEGRLDQLIFGMLRSEWMAKREGQTA